MFYTITTDAHSSTITVVLSDGETVILRDTDTNFSKLRHYLTSVSVGELSEPHVEREVLSIAHAPAAVAERLRRVSERVSVAGNTLYFDGDKVDNALSQTILNLVLHDTNDGYVALVNFLEKLQTNPSEASKNSLYEWIARTGLRILPNGNFTAYKGVQIIDEVSFSRNHGSAYVDGELVTGAIPNKTGSVIEMPRSRVDDNVDNGCSTGLHAGTYSYADWFAKGRVVLVEINPRDVVSVPSDSAFQKLRVSRYTVLDEVDQEINVVDEYDDLFSADDDDYGYDDHTDEDVEFVFRIIYPYLLEVLGGLVKTVEQEINTHFEDFVEQIAEDYVVNGMSVTAPDGNIKRYALDSVAELLS